MTHPDDELAIAAWIRRLTAAGIDVWMSWTHDTPVREAEARHAASLLGVPDARLRFFHAPDGHVVDHLGELQPHFGTLMAEVDPSRVVCGAFEQGHLDHDATNLLVNQSFDGPVFEAPFYHTYLTKFPRINQFADPTGEEVLPLSREESAFKLALARTYRSQKIVRNLAWANLRDRLLGRPAIGVAERLRLQTWTDFTAPNVPARSRDRVERSQQWSRWTSATRGIGS